MVLLYWSDMRAWGLQGTVDCNKKLTRHRRDHPARVIGSGASAARARRLLTTCPA